MSPSALAREVEALRFRLAFGLGGDPRALDDAVRRLQREAPRHPLALNLRAWAALPETALPDPEPALRPVAERHLRGDLPGALELAARAAALGSPRARVIEADLLLVSGAHARAWEALSLAFSALGPLPPLLLRRALLLDARGQPDAARDQLLDALVGNPLYGSALRALEEHAERRGRRLAPFPLHPVTPLTASTAHHLKRRWAAEGLAEAAAMAEALDPASAASFRSWRAAHREALRRFFAEGLWLD